MRPSSGKLFLLLSVTTVTLLMLGLVGVFTSTAEAKDEAWLGVSLQDLNSRLREAMDIESGVRGALVNSVVSDSPADKAGIRDGDVVVEVDDERIRSVDDLVEAIRAHDSGDKVLIVVERDGRQRGLTATLGTRDDNVFMRDNEDRIDDEVRQHLTDRRRDRRRAPRADRDDDDDDEDRHFTWKSDDDEGDDDRHFTWKSDDDSEGDDDRKVYVFRGRDGKKGRVHIAPRVLRGGNRGFLGVSTMNLGDQLAEYFQVPAGTGALVTQVVEDSAAEKAGLKAGDVILSVDGKKIDGPGELRRAIRKHDPEESVEIEIARDGARKTITATLGKGRDFGSVFFAPDDGNTMVLDLDELEHFEMPDLENLGEHLEILGEHLELENLGEHLKNLKLHNFEWNAPDMEFFMDDMDEGEWEELREKLHQNMKGLKEHLKDLKIKVRDHRNQGKTIRHEIRHNLRDRLQQARHDRRVRVVI